MKLYQGGFLGAGLLFILFFQGFNRELNQGVSPIGGRPQALPRYEIWPSKQTELIERGRYVVEFAGCNDCHTAGYAEAGGWAPEPERLKGNTLGYRGPWGTTYPTNLRLSVIRKTEAQWLEYSRKLETRPPMPWFNLRKMTDEDLKAVYAYIKQLPGSLGDPAPDFLKPNQEPKTPFIQWPGVK